MAMAAALWIILLGAVGVVFTAREDLSSASNLYYLMWKAGLRPYDQAVALRGLQHDYSLQKSLLGISRADFERRFPHTFHSVQHLPPVARTGQVYLVDSYEASLREKNPLEFVWLAVFEDDRLISFYYSKGA